MVVSDTLLDESIPNWYESHKNNVLVYKFNTGNDGN